MHLADLDFTSSLARGTLKRDIITAAEYRCGGVESIHFRGFILSMNSLV